MIKSKVVSEKYAVSIKYKDNPYWGSYEFDELQDAITKYYEIDDQHNTEELYIKKYIEIEETVEVLYRID